MKRLISSSGNLLLLTALATDFNGAAHSWLSLQFVPCFHRHHRRSILPVNFLVMNEDNSHATARDTASAPPALTTDPSFDILEWHPAYQSCQRFFLDHAQHEPATQALCALINIRLPCQWLTNPIHSSTHSQQNSNQTYSFNYRGSNNNNLPSPVRGASNGHSTNSTFVSLVPYIRRLIVTAFDKPPILHGFFGDDYTRGVLPHVDCERRNYLFAAKHGGWRSCKKQYDTGSGGGGDESVPFMKPLDEAKIEELTKAETAWSSWLAMEDWMVGPRAPRDEHGAVQYPHGGHRGNDGDYLRQDFLSGDHKDRRSETRQRDPGMMPQIMVDGVEGEFIPPP
nr:hypothetical protein CFP56_67788 [Quercus suber]